MNPNNQHLPFQQPGSQPQPKYPPFQQPGIPPQMPPFPPQPPQKKPNWFQRLSKRGKIVVIASIIIALFMCSALGNAVNVATKQQTSQQLQQPTPQPTRQATSPKPTPPKPTPPKPTPTPATTVEGRVEQLAAQAAQYGKEYFVAYAPENKILLIEETMQDGTGTEQNIKEECLRLHKTIWQNQSNIGQESFVLQLYDKASSKDLGYVGACQMRIEKAQTTPWDSLDAASAWEMYDSKSIF
ncbi:hypothetical protein EI42_06262 [Thermosporothrix hazakensis]|uniref:Uncharacterized protein n=1 Tax=Thermosporothrix hazakensis TaxID=644383 RepID=A0A326TQQ4_THEHA|nr:hypothetical protein [Thermosporothrix hazakensis]PZW18298.1 hypothetical protein EI42_06262 [Thermosporothrix hazakensis]